MAAWMRWSGRRSEVYENGGVILVGKIENLIIRNSTVLKDTEKVSREKT
jgi:hypothetical protein